MALLGAGGGDLTLGVVLLDCSLHYVGHMMCACTPGYLRRACRYDVRVSFHYYSRPAKEVEEGRRGSVKCKRGP